MFENRNNFILYYGVPVTNIGDVNDVLGAVGILARYDFIVIKPHTGADLVNLLEVIRAVRTINPQAKFFGYTSLGDAVDLATWEAQVDQWATDVPSQGMLAGIYIDNFGFTDGTGLATRANQNTAVTYVYNVFSTSPKLQVAVAATDPTHAIGSVDGQVEPVIATGTGVDYIVLDGFYLEPGATPEAIERMYGRIAYAAGEVIAATPALAANAIALPTPKLGVLLAARAGTATTSIPAADYAKILNLAEIYKVAGLGIMPDDAGQTSHQYYYKETANDFND